jgi:hypothetical protein
MDQELMRPFSLCLSYELPSKPVMVQAHSVYTSNHSVQPADPGGARSKVWVCCRSFDGIAVSNPAGDMYVCLL